MTNLMNIDDAFKLLQKYGISVPNYVLIHSIEESDKIDGLRYPVVLKLVSDEVIHKTEEKAIALNLRDKEEVLSSLKDLENKFDKLRDGGRLYP